MENESITQHVQTVGGRFQLGDAYLQTDYKQGAVILFVIIVLAIGALYWAYGEEATIDIPFQSQGMDCIYQESSTTETYACIFIAEKPTGITVRQDNLTEQEVEILEDIEEARENGTYEEPPRFDYKWGAPTPPDDDFEELIDIQERVCNQNKLSPSDTEVCRLLEAVSLCYRGFGKLETIQEVSSFAVTMVEPDIWKGWDYQRATYLKNLKLDYEECRAIQVEHDVVLSAQYWDMVVDGILQPQIYHGDIPTQDPFRSQVITEFTWKHTLGNAYAEICYGGNYGDAFKKQQGCNLTFEEGTGVLPNPDRNMDDYYLSLTPMQRYKAYQEDPHGFQADQLIYGQVGDWKVLKGKGK